MSRSLSMQFGSSGRVNPLGSTMKLVDSGEITDATVVTFVPDVGGMYLIATKEWNASTGAYRGHRIIVLAAPEIDKYGTTACAHGTAYASSNTGITTGYPSDSTVTLERSSATYAFRYAIYKVF